MRKIDLLFFERAKKPYVKTIEVEEGYIREVYKKAFDLECWAKPLSRGDYSMRVAHNLFLFCLTSKGGFYDYSKPISRSLILTPNKKEAVHDSFFFARLDPSDDWDYLFESITQKEIDTIMKADINCVELDLGKVHRELI